MNPRLGLTLAAILACLLIGCARQTGPRAVLLNTPAQLVSNGFALLDADKLDDAEREFTAASFARPDYAAATAGLALVQARRGDYAKARSLLEQAHGQAKENWEFAEVETARMEAAIQEARPDWLATVEAAYSRAVGYMPAYDRAIYVLATAYLKKYLFQEALLRFEQVASHGGTRAYLARDGAQLCRDIIEAAPRTEVGRSSCLIPDINRAELAALIVAETAYPWPPPGDRTQARDVEPIMPQFQAVNSIIISGFKGLGLIREQLFMPDKSIRRQDMAFTAVNLVAFISGVPNPKPSPFPPELSDLPREERLRTAVSLALDMRLMKKRSLTLFDSWGPVSGSAALLILRKAEKMGRK